MSRWLRIAETRKDIKNEILNRYNINEIESILEGNELLSAELVERESDNDTLHNIYFVFEDNIDLETFRLFIAAAGYKLKPKYYYDDVDELIDISVNGNKGYYQWHWINK